MENQSHKLTIVAFKESNGSFQLIPDVSLALRKNGVIKHGATSLSR